MDRAARAEVLARRPSARRRPGRRGAPRSVGELQPRTAGAAPRAAESDHLPGRRMNHDWMQALPAEYRRALTAINASAARLRDRTRELRTRARADAAEA